MIRKKDFAIIGVTVIGISIWFSCFSDIGKNRSVSDKGEPKKIVQANNENNKKTKTAMDYMTIPIVQLIGMADLIVGGTVLEPNDSNFTFLIDEVLSGNYASKTIEVKQFIPSKFDGHRSIPYANGQGFILFLTKLNQDSTANLWKILGIGGEGKMPVQENNYVYLEGFYLEGLERAFYEVQGVSRHLQRFNLHDFKDAVQNYGECFSWELVEYIKNNKKRKRWVPSKACHDNSVKNYQTKSWLHNYLVMETVKRIP